MYGLDMLDWVVILIKLEDFFEKHPEPRLNATRPLFGGECGRGSTGQQILTIPMDKFVFTDEYYFPVQF